MEEIQIPEIIENSDPQKTLDIPSSNKALQNKRIIFAAVAALVIIIGTIVGIFCLKNSSVYLYHLIDNGKAEKIVNLYNSTYNKSYKKQEKFIDKIDVYIEQKYDEYIADSLSYSQIIQKYNTISEVYYKASIYNDNIGIYIDMVEIAKEAKEKYQKGVAYLEQGKYKEAVEEFEELVQNVKRYPGGLEKLEEARAGYRQYILTESEKLMSQNNYQDAISLLKDGRDYFTDNSEFITKLSEITKTVTDRAISDAQNDFSNSGYEKAISDIEDAISIVGKNTELTDALEKYKEYIPVNICDMTPTNKSNREAIQHSENGTDNKGGSHKNVLYSLHHSTDHKSEWAIYSLDKKYDTLTFEAYRNNSKYTSFLKDNQDLYADETIRINIYGDNAILQTITIDKSFAPQSYTLNITDVQNLKIEFESGGTDASQWWNSLPGEIANVVVAKTK